MGKKDHDPYADLERIFHEPKRLAILSNLAGADGGMTFRELKDACDLTDGNLNRHLKVLEDSQTVRIEKEFVDGKPRTTVFLSDQGRRGFLRYLDALEEVLKRASTSARVPRKRRHRGGSSKKAAVDAG